MINIQIVITKTFIAFTIVYAMSLFLISCKKESKTPPNPNEEELITTLSMRFVDSAGIKPTVVVNYKDADGVGGNGPSIWDTIRLSANTTYFTTLLLLDETKSPADTISNEVKAEAVDHLFCFTVNIVNGNIQRTDSDANGLELGLTSTWRMGAMSSGSVQVELRHQPGIKNGSCTPGDTDVDVTFHCIVQ